MAIIETLSAAKVVPVIRTSSRALAETACEWLYEAGLRMFEITFTVPDAAGLIKALSTRDDIVVGAGTVLTRDDAAAAIDAGSAFVVSPATIGDVIALCHERGVPALPGAGTATEILTAHTLGAAVVKVFPASSVGGPAFLKSVKAVYPQIALMPTGGIAPAEIETYLEAGAVAVGMGSEMAPASALSAGDRQSVVDRARDLLDRLNGMASA